MWPVERERGVEGRVERERASECVKWVRWVFDACLDIEWWDLGENQVREVKVMNDCNSRGVYPLMVSANNRALIIKQINLETDQLVS